MKIIKMHPLYTSYGADEDGKVYNEQGANVGVNYHNKRNHHYFYIKYSGKRISIVLNRFVWECFNQEILDSAVWVKCRGDNSKTFAGNLFLSSKKSLVFGWGVNDSTCTVNGSHSCSLVREAYSDWSGILERVIVSKESDKLSAYKLARVVPEWKYFSNFFSWVKQQPNSNWRGCPIDKDLLSGSLELYGPDTCVYISTSLNLFIGSSKQNRGKYLKGVSKNVRGDFVAQCANPFKQKSSQFVGTFKTELEAHKAWQAKKHEYACQLAELQDDPRVADALRQRYAPDKDWTRLSYFKEHYNPEAEEQLTLLDCSLTGGV